MQSITYDYLVIGAGAAGLQLTLAMLEDTYFHHKKIAIIDKSDKDQNDKTWCYWEVGAGSYDEIIDHSWDKGLFITNEQQIDLKLCPYKYKKLSSLAFYQYAHEQIRKSDQSAG
ncbi:MAG: hypothetical protein IPL46_21995 [Saprospiraceae bacterium]|nr:hypothetical protein [Saprospiraceae bacterium]